MKSLLLIILFSAICVSSFATNYYIDSKAGSDSNDGNSPATAWKTITKVNSSFATLKPGDKVLFNRNESYFGTISITKSGTSGNPIVIGAYGSGSDPVINGFSVLKSWTNQGDGIYYTTISGITKPEILVIDGKQYWMGQYPNDGFLTYESFNSNLSITDNQLPATPDWTGAEVFIRKNPFVTNRAKITKHINQTLEYTEFTSGFNTSLNKNYGYIIQNDIKTLKDFGDWYFDESSSRLYIYFGNHNPSTFEIKIASLDNLLNISWQNYINIENLHFSGCNNKAISINAARYLTIQSCKVDFIGYQGLYIVWGATSSFITIDNSDFRKINGNAINIWADNVTFTNNRIDSIGLLRGSCYGSNDGSGISGGFNAGLIQYNEVSNVAHYGIFPYGNNFTIANNYIYNTVLEYLDAGAIYVSHVGSYYTGQIIKNNIIINAKGNDWGTSTSSSIWSGAEGIYLDSYNDNVTVDGNTVAKCNQGIRLFESQNAVIKNNTSFNNVSQFFINNTNSKTPIHPLKNITLDNNIAFAKEIGQPCLFYYSVSNDINTFGISDNNYWARPIDDNNVFTTYTPSTGTKNRTLEGWQTVSGMDIHSKKSPITVKDTADIKFYYNPSKSNKTIVLQKPMIDIKGTKYQSSITLLPYNSAILMVDPNPILPEVPVYSSSVIENAKPSLLELTYNLPLANSVPATSAFNVVVNSVVKSINSVSISGDKVLLTLSKPVVYGDVVTVDYTKPAVNPIKTTSGGEASSMGPQSVTNKVSSGIPIYLSSIVENLNPSLLEITFDLNLSELVIPPTTSFNVIVNSTARTISNISISGNKVRLTLSTPIVYGDAITVAYIKPASGGLQTPSGGEVETFSAKTVTNNVGPVAPVFVSAVVENTTPTIIDLSYNLSLANIVPAVTAFILTVNSTSRSISTVSIVSGKVRLTLPSPLSFGDIITISYVKPSTNPLQTSSGGQAESLSGKPVKNNINPAVPVYTSSVIEDATPGIIEMTYNMALANIIPSVYAFTVQVNSTSRFINSVSISSGKVRLTLSSNVVYGDIVTVSYTKPAVNPLQTPSGGLAASISLQPVTNKCFNPVVPNNLPVIDIQQNETDVLSGFVYELDASATYDPDGDLLTYSWDVPALIPVSSTTNMKIRFLAPIVSATQIFNITLNVNDGRDVASRILSITVNPYKPEFGIAKIDLIEASNYSFSDQPDNVNDGNLSTKWSIDGDNQWLTMSLTDPFKIDHVQIALLPTQKYESYFDILASKDNILWEPIIIRASSCDFSGNLQNFDFPVEKNSISYSYIKLVGHGNSLNNMNNYSEIKLFGTLGEKSSNPALQPENISIYPNPATDFINVLVLEPPTETQLLRIFDYSGVLRFTANIESGVNNLQIPISLFPGAYVAQVLLGKLIVYAKPLIVL